MIAFRILPLALTLTPMLLLGCKQRSPARPAGVPSSAVWAGGADGGAFFECLPSQKGEPNACTVYDDSTGAIYLSGKFVLQGQTRGAKADELRYDGTNGTRIYLDHNQVLIPVSPRKQ
jgi:hypothetical protein